jgi:hypothetical protein
LVFCRTKASKPEESQVAAENGPRDADFESASSRLTQGLKACQTMVANYRAMLRGDNEDSAQSSDDEENVSSSEPA